MADNLRDDHFRQFGQSLTSQIKTYGKPEESFYLRQKEQVERLVDLEAQFREALINDIYGDATYQIFIKYICDERHNILDARPYFRVRQPVFTKYIAPAFKIRSVAELAMQPFNYRLIAFVMRSRDWEPNGRVAILANQITELRTQLVVLNLPLVITRARIALKHARQLTFMDMIQIASEGLMAAIDKFTLPFSESFVSTVLGRIHGNLIEKSSETAIHFFPREKRQLYRANKFSAKMSGGIDWEKLAQVINSTYGPTCITDPTELSDLMTASVCISLDPPQNDDGEANTANYGTWGIAPEEGRPDNLAEANEMSAALEKAMGQLTILEQKVLRLRGISL